VHSNEEEEDDESLITPDGMPSASEDETPVVFEVEDEEEFVDEEDEEEEWEEEEEGEIVFVQGAPEPQNPEPIQRWGKVEVLDQWCNMHGAHLNNPSYFIRLHLHPIFQLVTEKTNEAIMDAGLEDYRVELCEIEIFYCLKIMMAMMILPVEEDYWKKGHVGALVYPDFNAYMPNRKFCFIKKYICFSSYEVTQEQKANDKMWKVHDIIEVARNVAKSNMQHSCGTITIDEAQIPCYARAPCL
jgi:hypothetical protein